MSDTEATYVALRNWARWARGHVVDLSIPEPPIFAQWLPGNAREPGWGDECAPDPIPDPVDEQAALEIDRLLLGLRTQHWRTIRRAFLLQRTVDRLELDAACRALADAIWFKRLTTQAKGIRNPFGKVRPQFA